VTGFSGEESTVDGPAISAERAFDGQLDRGLPPWADDRKPFASVNARRYIAAHSRCAELTSRFVPMAESPR